MLKVGDVGSSLSRYCKQVLSDHNSATRQVHLEGLDMQDYKVSTKVEITNTLSCFLKNFLMSCFLKSLIKQWSEFVLSTKTWIQTSPFLSTKNKKTKLKPRENQKQGIWHRMKLWDLWKRKSEGNTDYRKIVFVFSYARRRGSSLRNCVCKMGWACTSCIAFVLRASLLCRHFKNEALSLWHQIPSKIKARCKEHSLTFLLFVEQQFFIPVVLRVTSAQ